MVMMVRSDGAVIARWPIVEPNESRLESNSALSKAMAAGDMQGRIEGVSSVDGEDRLNAFRRLERYPIYVLAGIDRDAIIAGWQRQLAVLAAFTFPISMALVYVAWVALRRTRRELAAQQSLQHEIEQRARIESAMHHVQRLEALGRLTGGVAHDFNNLLTIVSNNLHLMRRLNPALADDKQLGDGAGGGFGRAVNAPIVGVCAPPATAARSHLDSRAAAGIARADRANVGSAHRVVGRCGPED